jgi:hypothetical protein
LEIGDTADLEIGAMKNFVLHPMNTDMQTFKRIVINKPMHQVNAPAKIDGYILTRWLKA